MLAMNRGRFAGVLGGVFLFCCLAAQTSGQQWVVSSDGVEAAPMPPQAVAPMPADMAEAPETLEDAWQFALHSDQRVEAGRWNVSSARSSLEAARAEQFPALRACL